jgi:hypothetical protein
LADEIEAYRRRVNALEYVLFQSWKRAVKDVHMRLEEMDPSKRISPNESEGHREGALITFSGILPSPKDGQ